MLKKIQLKNYRSCSDITFELQPDLSALIGPNGSGKTNILSGIVLLSRLLDEGDYHPMRDERPTGESILKAWFEFEGKKAILTATISIYTDGRNNDVVTSSRQSWYVKDFTGSSKRLEFPLAAAFYESFYRKRRMSFGDDYYYYSPSGRVKRSSFQKQILTGDIRSALSAIKTIAEWVSGITYYSASQFTNPSSCPVSIEVESGSNRISSVSQRRSTAAKYLADLYSQSRGDSDQYKDFLDIIGPNGIGLIDELSFKELPTSSVDYSVLAGGQVNERRVEKMLIVPQFQIGRNTLSPNQLSEGTFKTIALLFYLMTESRSLLLLEEPEVCVHHGLLDSILELMKTYSAMQQIVISTHSDFVIDHVDPRSVYSVTRSDIGETSIKNITKKMSRKDFKALKEYLKYEGNLGEYWKHGALD